MSSHNAQLDPAQEEAAKRFDYVMFDWVKENQLPLTGLKLQILKLIGDLYGGKKIESGKQIWAPSMKAKNRRHVLILGKGMVGDPAQMAKMMKPKSGEEENEFDVDRRNREAGEE